MARRLLGFSTGATTELTGYLINAHITLDGQKREWNTSMIRTDGGPDAAFSLEPHEFKRLVEDCRAAHAALGRVRYEMEESERGSLVFRRSLYVVADVHRGETFSRDNVRSIRPGYGLPPKYLPDILGRQASRDIGRGEPFAWEMVERASMADAGSRG